ncbi:hypothetical protein SAY87_023941 [Trapa incisa]|uniref:Glycosyltransferase n=1 Tax=Trapa incisa TaxID=236973 RepID=A0AAN7KZQ3_9MYRT|nr:hypothetical protein SAY87_023941 [Trapa incisa]
MASHNPHPISTDRKEPWLPAVGEVAVVTVPFPIQSHLNQLLHLSYLISSHGIPVHYVATTTHIQQAKLRFHGLDLASSVDAGNGKHHHHHVHFHGFEISPFPSPPADPNATSKFPSHLLPAFEAVSSHLCPHVVDLVRSLASGPTKRVVVIRDSLMSSVVQDVLSLSKTESYIFQCISAFSICWFFANDETFGHHLATLGEYGEVLLKYPSPEDGCFPDEFVKYMELQSKLMHLTSGSLYNTSRILEEPFIELLKNIAGNQKQWAVGPFNPVMVRADGPKDKCIEWLDGHPENSVIYVSFGTTVTLSKDQIHEIALGLEGSGHRFIWVLRQADRGDIFDREASEGRGTADSLLSLPVGFEQRVEGVGLVMREWAPQHEILRHPSVGGFMSHCGWNSCMESVKSGVPIVAWPMHGDQLPNCILVTRVLKVGIMVKEWSVLMKGGVVESSAIKQAVEVILGLEEGDGMRKRVGELGKAIQPSPGDGGVSLAELDSFIAHITR